MKSWKLERLFYYWTLIITFLITSTKAKSSKLLRSPALERQETEGSKRSAAEVPRAEDRKEESFHNPILSANDFGPDNLDDDKGKRKNSDEEFSKNLEENNQAKSKDPFYSSNGISGQRNTDATLKLVTEQGHEELNKPGTASTQKWTKTITTNNTKNTTEDNINDPSAKKQTSKFQPKNVLYDSAQTELMEVNLQRRYLELVEEFLEFVLIVIEEILKVQLTYICGLVKRLRSLGCLILSLMVKYTNALKSYSEVLSFLVSFVGVKVMISLTISLVRILMVVSRRLNYPKEEPMNQPTREETNG